MLACCAAARRPSVNDVLSAPAIGACNRADGGFKDLQLGDYMTGLRVFDDAYTKNLRIQCGTAIVDAASRTFRIGKRTLGYENILWVHVQDNDRSATLSCADDEVLVGLKLALPRGSERGGGHVFPTVLLEGQRGAVRCGTLNAIPVLKHQLPISMRAALARQHRFHELARVRSCRSSIYVRLGKLLPLPRAGRRSLQAREIAATARPQA